MSQGDSNYKMVKDGWGSRPNFQASYGLNMNPSGIAKGNKILDAFRQADAKSSQQAHSAGSNSCSGQSKSRGTQQQRK